MNCTKMTFVTSLDSLNITDIDENSGPLYTLKESLEYSQDHLMKLRTQNLENKGKFQLINLKII